MREPIVLASNTDSLTYSLPSLRRSPGRTLVVAYECHDADDGTVSIYVRSSFEHGFRWEEPIKILGADTGPHTDSTQCRSALKGMKVRGYIRPSFLIDMMSGRISLLSNVLIDGDDQDMLYMVASYSDDEGETWEHQDVTTQVTGANSWTMRYGFPGHGIQLRQGVLTGRLIQPASVVDTDGVQRVVTLCSDDQGITWWTSEPAGEDINGAGIVELSDGKLMIKSGGLGRCSRLFSRDGGRTWPECETDDGQRHEWCSSTVDRVFPCAMPPSEQSKCVAYPTLAPDEETVATMKASFDDAKTWPVSYDFARGPLRRPDMCAMPDLRLISVAYEGKTGIELTHVCLDDVNMRELAYGWNEHTREQDQMLRERGFIS